jgi:hypothetical protein
MHTLSVNKKYLLAAALFLSTCAFGPTARADSDLGENYVTGTSMRATTSDGREGLVPAGTMVTMLGNSGDATMVHFGVDSDDESVPSEIWVKMSDVAAMKLEIQVAEDDVSDGFSDEGGLSFLEDAGHARHRGRGHRGKGGMTYCYRGVKNYLLAHHMVSSYLPGASAWMAATTLPKYGFHKVSESPEQAKLNDVCVYHGGRGGNGHIEVKVAGGWYYGYGVIPHAIRNHPFIACFRKN